MKQAYAQTNKGTVKKETLKKEVAKKEAQVVAQKVEVDKNLSINGKKSFSAVEIPVFNLTQKQSLIQEFIGFIEKLFGEKDKKSERSN